MKNWKVYLLGVIILILLGVLLFLFSQKSSSQSPQTSEAQTIPSPTAASPSAVAQGFYVWYMRGEINDSNFEQSAEFLNGASQWLTPNFIANYQTIAANTDVNPFILAQDYENSWATTIQATLVSQSPTTCTVLVTLGDASEEQKLLVHMLVIDGNWRIDSVTSPS